MSSVNTMMLWRQAQRMGLVGLLGLCLLGAAAWTHWVWLPKRQAEINELGSQARRTRHDLMASSAAPASSQTISSPQQAWLALWQGLPDAQQRVNLQAMVLKTAKAQGLQISSVQYQGSKAAWSAHDEQVLWRQRMEMPVEGSYPALRQWLTGLLDEPAVAIDAVDMQRLDVMSNQVKARVVVSLWWRKPEKGAP